MKVFTYWQGNMPSLIEILLELMMLHSKNGDNYEFIHLNRDSFLSENPDVPDCFDALSPNHQSDLVRVFSISKHGGIWLDADTLVMNSLLELNKIIENKGFFVTQNNQCLCAGVFGSPPNTLLMNEWKSYQIDLLKKTGPTLPWESLGNSFLTQSGTNRKELFDDYIILDGLASMYPVNWDQCVKAYLEQPYWKYKYLTRNFQPLIILVNSVYKALSPYNRDQILDSEYPLNYFINKSLRRLVGGN